MALWWGRSPRGSSLTPGPTYRSRAPASPFACTPLRSYASIPHTSQSCSFADCCPLGVSPSGGSAGMCSRLVLLCCAETQCEFGLWRGCDACARDERAQKRAEEAEESEEGSRGQISRALASVSSMLLCVLNCSFLILASYSSTQLFSSLMRCFAVQAAGAAEAGWPLALAAGPVWAALQASWCSTGPVLPVFFTSCCGRVVSRRAAAHVGPCRRCSAAARPWSWSSS